MMPTVRDAAVPPTGQQLGAHRRERRSGILRRIAVILITVLAASASLPAQDIYTGVHPKQSGSAVTVRVIDVNGTGIAGAEVQVADAKWRTRSGKTNKSGIAQFADIRPGSYEVVVAARGYLLYRGRISVEADKPVDLEAKLVAGSFTPQTPPAEKPKP